MSDDTGKLGELSFLLRALDRTREQLRMVNVTGEGSFETTKPSANVMEAMRKVRQELLPDTFEVLRANFEGGNERALMLAIRNCAEYGVPLPEWVSAAYIKAYDAVSGAAVKSWDDVFGAPYPKGTQLAALRKRRRLRFAVRSAVAEILREHPQTPIDEALFERVGERFNIGKTLASDLYYMKGFPGNF